MLFHLSVELTLTLVNPQLTGCVDLWVTMHGKVCVLMLKLIDRSMRLVEVSCPN